MIVDSSALIAILLDEPEAASFVGLLLRTSPRVSAGTLVELAAVGTRRFHGRLDGQIDDLFTTFALSVVAVSPEQATIARAAYRRYGIGTGHPAGLNFGDCFSYALAKATRQPLLFKGDDFPHTDIVSALTPPPPRADAGSAAP